MYRTSAPDESNKPSQITAGPQTQHEHVATATIIGWSGIQIELRYESKYLLLLVANHPVRWKVACPGALLRVDYGKRRRKCIVETVNKFLACLPGSVGRLEFVGWCPSWVNPMYLHSLAVDINSNFVCGWIVLSSRQGRGEWLMQRCINYANLLGILWSVSLSAVSCCGTLWLSDRTVSE